MTELQPLIDTLERDPYPRRMALFGIDEQLQTNQEHEAGPDKVPVRPFPDELPLSPTGQELSCPGRDRHDSHDGMVQRNLGGGGMVTVRMAEQHQPSHDCKQRQRDSPSRMGKPSEPPQEFNRADRKRQNPVDLVLKNLGIIAEEGLNEGERSDRPGVVITPNEEKHPAQG